MQLIITKENSYLELPNNVKIRANDFGVWFWDNFFNVDAKVIKDVSKIDLTKYSNVFRDFKQKVSQPTLF
jgi:hypothetical protein